MTDEPTDDIEPVNDPRIEGVAAAFLDGRYGRLNTQVIGDDDGPVMLVVTLVRMAPHRHRGVATELKKQPTPSWR